MQYEKRVSTMAEVLKGVENILSLENNLAAQA